MASCAAGMASRVYDQNMELVYTFMVGTWGHLFIANKKEEHKNTCEPTNFYTPLGVLCNNMAESLLYSPISTRNIVL